MSAAAIVVANWWIVRPCGCTAAELLIVGGRTIVCASALVSCIRIRVVTCVRLCWAGGRILDVAIAAGMLTTNRGWRRICLA